MLAHLALVSAPTVAVFQSPVFQFRSGISVFKMLHLIDVVLCLFSQSGSKSSNQMNLLNTRRKEQSEMRIVQMRALEHPAASLAASSITRNYGFTTSTRMKVTLGPLMTKNQDKIEAQMV